MGFTKLFSSIITSSIWSEDDKVRIMWITMLASADADGRVAGAVPGMAAIARMSLEDAERSIEKLCSPDPYSRTPDHEGRRLLPVDGGWQIVNYRKYRGQRDEDARREYQRNWDRQNRPSGYHRAKSGMDTDLQSDHGPTTVRHSPTQSDHRPTQSDRVRPGPTQAEAEAEADIHSPPVSPPSGRAKRKPDSVTFDYSTGKFSGIESAAVAWREAYPHVDVMQEIRKAGAWLMANPDRRKKRISRFLVNWLARAEGDRVNGGRVGRRQEARYDTGRAKDGAAQRDEARRRFADPGGDYEGITVGDD